MSEPGTTEQNSKDNPYGGLIEKFPPDKVLTVSKSSFPDWQVTKEEEGWARSFLSAGNNDQVIESFSKYLTLVGKKGLQLLRNSSGSLVRESKKILKQELNEESLLTYLRNRFQADSLFFEEGLRKAGDIDNNYWNDEEDGQLIVAQEKLRQSKGAFKEFNAFVNGRTDKLNALRVFLKSEFEGQENTLIHNENFFRENRKIEDDDNKFSDDILNRDSEDLAFLGSLESFAANLELGRQQK